MTTNFSYTLPPAQTPIALGVSGQVLGTDGTNLVWVDRGTTIPVGGASGQVLTTDGATYFWVNRQATIAQGSSGQVLSTDGTNFTWVSKQDVLPQGSVGQYLTTSGSVLSWVDKPTTDILPVLQYSVPTTGTTVSVLPATDILILEPAGILATLTIALPVVPTDRKKVTICGSGNLIMALSITSSGATVGGSITALSANTFATYVYRATSTKWYRCG